MKTRYWLLAIILILLPLMSMGQNAPEATGVSILNSPVVGITLEGDYTWGPNGDTDNEGVSTYKWTRADDAAGTNPVVLGETTTFYTLVSADEGKYIFFEVTPVDDETVPLSGTPVEVYVGPVTPNTAPTATGVSHTGDLINGSELTGSFTYFDAEGDLAGTHTYRWLRADDDIGTNSAPIGSATSTTYTLTAADITKYISFEVTPVAATGLSPGTAVPSTYRGPVTNAAPVASSVEITGTFEVGEELTGGYSYSDEENDTQGTSTFKWYRADDGAGTNAAAIGSATSQNYVITSADIGKHISFEVTPVASAGTSPGVAEMSAYDGPVNHPPVASTVVISGTYANLETLTGSFSYSDNEGDAAGTHTYKWYRADDGAGAGAAEISGANSITYDLTTADVGKYISFEVTPVATTGSSPGTAVPSAYGGPVLNLAPVASSVNISGTFAYNQTLTGTYNYDDAEGDAEGTSIFKWYRADDAGGTNSAEIAGQISITYVITVTDLNKFIRFEVTPVAQAGISPGTTEVSSFQGPVAPPDLDIFHAGLNEGNLAGALITLTLTNETFIQDGSLTVTLNNEPAGVDYSLASITGPTTAEVTLSFTQVDIDTDVSDFSISILGGEMTSGLAIQSNDLTIDAFTETLTLDPDETPMTEANLSGMVITLSLTDVSFVDGTLDLANFTLNNAPALTFISNLEYSDPTNASITLYYNEADFEPNITNFNITINEAELTSPHTLSSANYTIEATVETLQVTATPNLLTERNVDEAQVVLTLTGETFDATLDFAHFDERDEWPDLTVKSLTRDSDTQVTLTLNYDNDDRDADKSDFYIRVYSDQISGTSGVSSNFIYLQTYDEELTISGPTLNEDQLDTQSILLTLTEDQFIDATPDISKYKLREAPPGLFVESITYHNPTSATLNLEFDGTDFDSDYTIFHVRIEKEELISDHRLDSENNMPITATVEYPSAAISGAATICDDGSTTTFNVDLTGSPNWSIRVYKDGVFYVEETGINGTPYDLVVSEAGTYTIDDVKDSEYTSYDGSAPTSGSATLSYHPTPTADFDGQTYTVCEGTNVALQIDLTGTGPWVFDYEVGVTEMDAISTSLSTYTLNTTDAGQYKITEIDDALCPGNHTVSTKAWIENYDKPEANIIGTSEICSGETTELSVVLSGDDATSWDFEVRKDNVFYQLFTGIGTSPHNFDVSVAGTYTVLSVSDEHCTGETSGSATVTVHPLPDVQIVFLQDAYWVGSSGVNLVDKGTPADGVWTGTGVSGTDFYPNIADIGAHLLTYTYEEPVHNCEDFASKSVQVIATSGAIEYVSQPDTVFCNYETPISIQASNTESVIGYFKPFPGLTDNGDNTATLDPAIVYATSGYGAGTFSLTYEFIYLLDFVQVQRQFTIEDPGYAKVLDFDDKPYCENNDPFDMEGNIFASSNFEGEGIFSGNGIIGDVGSGFQFDPGDASVLYPDQGINTLTYTFTTTNGCIVTDNVQVVVNRIPSIGFSVADNCLNFVDSTIFINSSDVGGNDFIQGFIWDFGDNTISNEVSPIHLYSTSGLKNVNLKATTNNGCKDFLEIPLDFWDRPIAAFDWNNDCFSDAIPVSFTDLTDQTTVTITDWTWNIYNSSQTLLNSDNTQNKDYVFLESNFYDVELIVNTGKCKDTLVQNINMKPTMRLATAEYVEDFEAGMGHWFTDELNEATNSWQFGTPAASRITEAASGTKAWVTNLSGEYLNSETSWITGPCFDFRNTKRPMIKMNIFSDMENQRDGAVLQYSLDNGLTWTRVGDADDGKGIKWYNTTKIDANPGNEQHGWTGYDLDWKEARHDLDELIGQTDVKFRIVFGSSLDINDEGIGIDDISITERSRLVVLEHFTNLTDDDSDNAEFSINNIANKDTLDVIDIHYHVNFPGSDAMNVFYPAGPSARTLYYSVADVPYSVMDGKDHFISNLGIHEWSDTVMVMRALVDPQVVVNLDAEFSGSNTLNINAQVNTLIGFDVSDAVTLHLVVLEEVVTENTIDFENVVRAMLPDPGGTQIFNLGDLGSYNLTESWTFDPAKVDTAMIVVVAYVQDEDTKEIYQAAVINFGGVATNVFGQKFEQMKFNLYPNPVSDEMYISFNGSITDQYEMEIFNDMGVLIDTRIIHRNTSRVTIAVGNYAEGVYTVKISNGTDKMGWRRFIVIH